MVIFMFYIWITFNYDWPVQSLRTVDIAVVLYNLLIFKLLGKWEKYLLSEPVVSGQ